MYLSTSTSTEDFPEMYLSTIQVLYKLYLSTDVLKYKVLLPGSGHSTSTKTVLPRRIRYRVLSKVILKTIARVNFCCGTVATVDRLNNTTRVSATKECSLGWPSNTKLPDTVPKIIKTQTKSLSTFKTQRNPLDSFQNIYAIRFQQLGNDANAGTVCVPWNKLRDPKSCRANGWRWRLVRAPKSKQPMFDIDSRSALPCVFVSHYRPYCVCLPLVAC